MAEIHNPSVPLSLFFFIVTCISGFLFLTESANHGFSVELIHRDSPKSPLYTESSHLQKLNNAFLRSIKRGKHFYPNSETKAEVEADMPESQVIPITGEYIMAYSLGTPPFKIFGIADTGSDLVWSQCLPCRSCYNQKAPLFDRSKSSTFKNISCFDQKCTSTVPCPRQTCCEDGTNLCQYSITYADSSVSTGNLVIDTLTLGATNGRQVAFPNIMVGCGYINGPFSEDTSGIVGLGGGSVSLVSQIRSSIDGKFSYCLAPLSSNTTTKLNFGANGVVSGAGTVSTPMVKKDPATFYYLTLEAISVGDKRIAFTSSGNSVEEGNIIIDSGTTLTLLPEDFYSKLESEVAAQVKLQRVDDPLKTLNLCYKSSSQTIEAPIMTAHFRGADVRLSTLNTFTKVSGDVFCFAFYAFSNGVVFGNIAQTNFLVGYDIQKKLVSFKPVDCTKL